MCFCLRMRENLVTALIEAEEILYERIELCPEEYKWIWVDRVKKDKERVESYVDKDKQHGKDREVTYYIGAAEEFISAYGNNKLSQ